MDITFLGVDLNPLSLELAREAAADYPEIGFKEQDVLAPEMTKIRCDVVISSLTMHHFSESEIFRFTKRFNDLASIGVVINDLQRSALAYLLFRMFSFFFIRTRTARLDGLTSITRGFTKNELQNFAKALPGAQHHIQWKWAFRYVWVFGQLAQAHS